MIDPTKVQFATEFNIDKIAAYSSMTDSFPSSVQTGISYVISAGYPLGFPFLGYTLKSIPNPYAKKCLTSLSWSVDGTSFYDQDSQLQYYNATSAQMMNRMQVSCGCSDSTIYFFFQNSYTSDQTVYLIFAIDSIT